jgi:acyl carrier protein
MSVETIKEKVKEIILQVADQQGLDINTIEDHQEVVADLGFSSLDVATLTALFEKEFGVNPFLMGIAAVTEVRTINDIGQVY